MSDTRFTPGPWVIGKPMFGARYIRADPKKWDGMGYQFICSLPVETKVDFFEANAILISAAPDMYEALKALVDGIDQYDGFVALGDMVTARAAISKAEGRDSQSHLPTKKNTPLTRF